MFKKIKRYAKNPFFALGCDLTKYKISHLMPDKYYLSLLWQMKMGYKIDWKHPKTFSEKLQWLKLYDHNPLHTTLVDKYRVKQWVEDKIGKQYVIPTLAVYQSVDDIHLNELPDKFVLKCNQDSGSIIVCRDKSVFDFEAAKQKLNQRMNQDFYYDTREWPYKNVKRCIIAEPYVNYSVSQELLDYKFFAFDGAVRALYIASGRHFEGPCHNFCCDFFDLDFNHLDVICNGHPQADVVPRKPNHFDEMVRLSSILSKGIAHVRCDSSRDLHWSERPSQYRIESCKRLVYLFHGFRRSHS